MQLNTLLIDKGSVAHHPASRVFFSLSVSTLASDVEKDSA